MCWESLHISTLTHCEKPCLLCVFRWNGLVNLRHLPHHRRVGFWLHRSTDGYWGKLSRSKLFIVSVWGKCLVFVFPPLRKWGTYQRKHFSAPRSNTDHNTKKRVTQTVLYITSLNIMKVWCWDPPAAWVMVFSWRCADCYLGSTQVNRLKHCWY